MYLKGLAQSEFGNQLPAIPTGYDSPSAYGDGANYGYEVPADATWGEDQVNYGELPVWSETLPSYPSPSSETGPTQNFDWTGLISTAIKTYGQIETAKTQAETQRTIAQRYPTVQPGAVYPSSPFSPFTSTKGAPGALLGIPLAYWLVGGAAVAAVVMLKG